MTDAVRWGLLSTARINQALIAGIRAAEGAELVAVASRSEASASAYAAEQQIPRAHGSYEALLADPEVDVVYVSLPNALHVPWSIAALRAGKHVLCEKPMTRRAADVVEAYDVAAHAERLLMEAFMWRYHPQTELVARLAGDGTLGELRQVRAAFSFSLPDAGNVRWDPALEGGALMDVGCYCVSALRLLCGEPERVSCETVDRGGVDAHTSGLLRFGGGVLGTFECAFDSAPRSFLEVTGSEGRLLVEDPWKAPGPGPELVRADGSRERLEVEVVNPYAREVGDLSRAVREGGEPRLGRNDALGQALAIEALYRAASEGRPVAV
jgi:D-xylose 1-dehydrogenase (NADP+, D-xylono-1,5-lactone-forming)